MHIDLSQSPYFDDFSSDKNYHKVLFRPSYAVQARELTQLQTILQNQIKEFGKNIFQNGSIVTGGQMMLEVTGVKYVAIESQDLNGNVINLNNFIGKFIVDGDGSGVRAYVIAGAAATDTSPTVLIVKYTSSQIFNVATTQPISTEDGAYSVNLLASLVVPIPYPDVISNSILGDASICSIDEGVFFVNGYFVEVSPQTIILDAFSNTPTYRVGLQIEDEVIDATQDSSLLDPAQDATNYQAPGANRYKFALTLVKRSMASTDDTQFIELLRVSNGVLTKKVVYPTYSVLEDTLARRTNDQSGSFTVRPFKIALAPHATYSNAYNIIVEAGKAYVTGYEFETIAPLTLKAERARSVANVTNYNTTIDYQNWIEVTNLVGPIPIKTLQSGVLHCVNSANIATSNAAVAANTVIGTLRIRALEYESGANSTSISTGIWRAYTFDANVGASVVANCKSASTGSANTIYLAPNFSSINNAYQGVKITITANAGSVLNETRSIGTYDGPNNLATLASGETFTFGIPGAMTQYRLDYELKDSESIVYANTSVSQHVFSTKMDVSSTSKYALAIDPYQGAYIAETNFNRAILQLPYPTIADQTVVGGLPLGSTEYWGRKMYTSQSFSSSVISITSAAGITSAVNGAPLSGSDAVDNVLVVIKSNTGSSLANNQVINFSTGNALGNTITVTTTSNTSTWTITVPTANSAASADVYVKVKLPYSHAIGSLLKTKSAKIANTASGLISGGTQIPDSTGLVQWYSQGAGALGAQLSVYSNSAAWLTLKNPGAAQSLYAADGIKLSKVVDLGNKTVSDANVAAGTDITSRYNFDSGQRDNSYEHASISLKPTSQGPTGNTVIYLDYFAHSGSGYLTVDSYASGNVAYGNIPSYTSATTGHVYHLRDCIDFRPRRIDADSIGAFDEEIFGISGLGFETDFSYYLARIDKIILTKDRTFEVLQGVPSLFPVPPADKENAMTLYTLVLPPYTANTSEIRQRYTDNRRYTMRDIGTLEKRITNLEYYTSLNLLEQAAKNQEITDDTGANRFKNGIMVDSFTGHSIGDVLNPDYHCSMDVQNREMRPPFALQGLPLSINESNSTNYARTGSIVSLPYTSNTFIDQSVASQAINVNPFNTVSFIGQIQLDPSSDTWVDTNRAPDVHVNLEGDNDAWASLVQMIHIVNPGKIFGTTWNSWQTTWAGVPVQTNETIIPANRGWLGPLGHYVPVYGDIINRSITDITQTQVRSGVTTSFVPATITQNIGNKVIDVSIIPRIRSRGVLFIGKMFAPNTEMYPFFDGVAVNNYCNRPNIVKVESNTVNYIDTYQQGEAVRVWDPARGQNTAHAIVVLKRHETDHTNVSVVSVTGGDDANIANSYFVHTSNATFLIGSTSGANSRISGYYHNAGFVTNPGASSITLSHDMANSNNGISNTTIVGMPIMFTSGVGLGQSSTITSYNYLTREVVFSPSLTITPDTTTAYSIGQLKTDYRGELTGIFVIPSTSDISFRTGERQFTLMDTSSGILDASNTNGSVKYFSQGLLQTVDNTVISIRVPGIQRTILGQQQTVTTTKVTDTVVGRTQIGYWDPLAQTFLVDQKTHPSGIQLTGIRLLFKSKDQNIPLQLQLRPVVNGFPHSSQVIPGSDVVINPSDIIEASEAALAAKYAANLNPFDDPTLYTQIDFGGPVYLQQGAEYSVILMANSQKYEVYISNFGSKILGTDRLISSQPYLGVLFKSQNSTTWNPIQEQDLTFRLLYAQYNPALQSNIEFQLSASSGITANVPLDTFYVTSGNLLLPNTSISTAYSTTTAAGVHEEFRTFQLDENVYFDDTLGRRVATSTANSFKLRFILSTLNQDISPLMDLDRLSVLAIENLINVLGISNTSLVVANSSTNWVSAANLSVTISGGGGSGANAYIANTNIDSTNMILANVVVDAAGSGYTSSPTITISGNTALSANIVMVGETYPSGGPAVARYITRKVTLADGMDAGDFRVYFAAYKPSNATISVYYKILSADDMDVFDNKGYQLMTVVQGQNNISLNQQDLKDYVYAPGTNNIADNRVQYGSFVSFKYFAIKIVLASSDTTMVPRIRDFRVVAVPSLS
jgi:hypothetical protein